MTREEIREGIDTLLQNDRQGIVNNTGVWITERTEEILQYLHSKGVVIKIEVDCIECGASGRHSYNQMKGQYESYCVSCQGEKKKVTYEPLIKEKL